MKKMKRVTIEAYIARDEDNSLYLYETEPCLNEELKTFYDKFRIEFCLPLDNSLFPNIKHKNSPKKVKMTLTLLEEDEKH